MAWVRLRCTNARPHEHLVGPEQVAAIVGTPCGLWGCRAPVIAAGPSVAAVIVAGHVALESYWTASPERKSA